MTRVWLCADQNKHRAARPPQVRADICGTRLSERNLRDYGRLHLLDFVLRSVVIQLRANETLY